MGLVAKAFQDIITFSRASSGTYVNSNGYITNSSVLNYLTYSNQPENAAWTKSNSFVQQNLLTYSEQFDNAAWSKVGVTVAGADINATIAPDGTLTADKIAEDATTSVHAIYQAYSAVSGTIYTMSFYAKAAERTWVRTRGDIGVNYFNLAAGTVGTTAGGVTATIMAVGNGWYRCVATKTSATTGVTNSQIAPTTADNVDSYAGTAGSGVFIWGAQLVQGSVPGDYRATTSAALPCLYADYNGALRARKICENAANSQHYWSQTTAVTAGVVYTVSFRVKAAEKTQIVYTWNTAGAAFNTGDATFNLSAGTVTPGGAATGTITALGSGWYLCTTTNTCVTTSAASAHYLAFTALTTYVGDGTSGVYIADVQVNEGSSALAYYDTTASAYNAPRFDYDPVTLAAKGLLVEESRTNLLLQANDFQTSWTTVNITRTLNSILSPSGNVDGVKIAATATAATVETQGATVAATSATGSAYVKQGTSATTANFFTLRNQTTLTDLISGTLNYSTGVFTYITGSTGVVVLNAGNGWWRIAISATAGITSGDTVRLYVGFAGGAATAGDFLYAYGAQLEAGAFATSYIPTTASQVTRAADVASVNTLSPWYNSAAGTWFAEFETIYTGTLDANRWLIGADNSANKRMIYLGATSFLAASYDGATVLNAAGPDVTGGISKAAMTYLPGTARTITTEGVAPSSGTCAAGFEALSSVTLGGTTAATNSYLCGWLRRITFYPRVLTSAELQTLTTL